MALDWVQPVPEDTGLKIQSHPTLLSPFLLSVCPPLAKLVVSPIAESKGATLSAMQVVCGGREQRQKGKLSTEAKGSPLAQLSFYKRTL